MLIDTRSGTDTREAVEKRRSAIAAITSGVRETFLNGFLLALVGSTKRTGDPGVLSRLRALAAVVPDLVLIGCQRGMMGRPDSRDLLCVLGLFALVLVGVEDTMTPLHEARAMAAALPQATLTVIPDAGHTPTLERPGATWEALAAFLSRLP